VTDGIVAKFDGSDDLTLHAASGATFSGLSAATLSDTDVVALDAGDNAVTLSDFDDGKVTNEIIAKFDALDRLTLNANQGTTFQALSATTLGDARVFVLDAFDNAVTLTNGQVTDAIVIKFDSSDTLTLNASGATLSALSAATLGNANATLALNADDDAITLTADQFVALGIAGDSIDAGDAITIESGSNLNALNLNSVGGGAVAVRFDALDDGSDDIANFDVATDTLQFSLTAFSGLSQTGAIDANAFLSGVLTGNGAEGTADTRFLYDTSSGNLFYDENGITAGGVVQVAALTTGTVLTENDIVMIA
jgi:hypothetical protein